MTRDFSEKLEDYFYRTGAGWANTGPLARPFRWLAWGAFMSILVWRNPLCEARHLSALFALWRWQIRKRSSGRDVVLTWPTGERLRLPTWNNLAGVVLATGWHEPDQQLFCLQILRAGDAVIDVGANIGYYTIPLALAGARVYSFEPSSKARGVLNHNVQLNGVSDSVWVFSCAVGASDGRVRLTTDRDVSNRVKSENSSGGFEWVDMRALDGISLAGNSGENRLKLLKIDAEGLDEEVVRGAANLIRRALPIVVVEVWDGGRGIRELLGPHGYRLYRFNMKEKALSEVPTTFEGAATVIAAHEEQVAEIATLLDESEITLKPPRVDWRAANGPEG